MNRPTVTPTLPQPQVPVQPQTKPERKDRGPWIPRIQKALFWSWNWLFLLFIFFGVVPVMGLSILSGFTRGEVNLDFFLFFTSLAILIPAACWTGFTKFRHDPQALFRILYGVEVPLLLLTAFRVIFIREMNPGVVHLLSVFALGSIAFLATLYKRPAPSGALGNGVQLAGTALFFWCALWVFGFLAFLAPPTGWNTLVFIGKVFVEMPSLLFRCPDCNPIMMLPSMFTATFFFLAGSALIAYTASLFAALPFVYVYLGTTAFKQTFTANWRAGRRKLALAVTIAVLVANTGLFVAVNQQHHAGTLEKLQAFDGSEAAKRELLVDSAALRQELTDIYLSPYRYLGDADRSNSMQALYKKTFGLSRNTTEPIQNFFNAMAAPLLYSGSGAGMAQDQKEAERLYEWFFDITIQEGEREALRHALKATYSREQRDAGLINIDNKKVHLEKQTVNRVEYGDWAEIEIHETYVNQGPRQEEVFYHFAMPENSVITGVWLGENESHRFRFQVASRGAAQKVYKRIQQQRQDPALLEQVGPNLYRLRVFPVPGNRFDAFADSRERKMHLWWTFKVMRGEQGWPMPQLIEKRNVYWDSGTEWNGKRLSKSKTRWLPQDLSFADAVPSGTLSAVVADGVEIRASEFQPADFPSRKSGKFALVLETSYSMGQLRGALRELKTRLASDPRLTRHDWDFFRLGHRNEEVASLDELFTDEATYFGAIDAADILARFDALKQGRAYDGVIVLTDRSSFKEKERTGNSALNGGPVWFYMLDGNHPRVTGDGLMRGLIATGGGLETGWNRLMHKIDFAPQGKVIALDHRYVWTRHATMGKPEPRNGFEDLAAAQYIRHLMKKTGAEETNRAILPLHELARSHEIVTPYSSMIVLVNQGQKDMLKEAEKDAGRFQRDMETGQEILSAPNKPFEVSAVPEPEEWALIGIVLTLLLHRLYRNRESAGFQRAAF